MSVLVIRELINRAISLERKHKHFLSYLEQNPRELHSSIQTSATDKPHKLVSFVMTYTRHAPELIQKALDSSKRKGLEIYVDPVVNLIVALFEPDREDIETSDQLMLVASSAYLAHRFIEELNDWLFGTFGHSLVTADYTDANLLIHEILGDTYVNKLERMITQVSREFSLENKSYTDEIMSALNPSTHSFS